MAADSERSFLAAPMRLEINDAQDLSPDDGLSSGDHDRILYGDAK